MGPHNPSYRHGLSSKDDRYRIPAQFYDAYQRALDAPDYLDNQRELALLSTQIDGLNHDLVNEADPARRKGIRKEIRDTIKLRGSLSDIQLRHEAHRDQHISYVEAMAMVKVLQDELRDLAYETFGKEARPFLQELETRWAKVLFNVGG